MPEWVDVTLVNLHPNPDSPVIFVNVATVGLMSPVQLEKSAMPNDELWAYSFPCGVYCITPEDPCVRSPWPTPLPKLVLNAAKVSVPLALTVTEFPSEASTISTMIPASARWLKKSNAMASEVKLALEKIFMSISMFASFLGALGTQGE